MTPLLIDWAVKVTIIMLLVGGAAVALHRSAAATRHLVWSLGIAVALAIPPVSLVVPGWAVPGLSDLLRSTREAGAAADLAAASIGSGAPAVPALQVVGATQGAATVYQGGEMPRERARGARGAADASASTPQDQHALATTAVFDLRERADRGAPAVAGGSAPSAESLALVWALGVAVVAAIGFGGLVRRRRWARSARPSGDSRVPALLRELARVLGVRRPIRVVEGGSGCVPMTWGTMRPVIFLPVDAAAWEPSRLRAVLLHELAHVKRHDYLTQLVARAACAIYWFHPLIWLAARRLRVERELACDDLVLTAGSRASEYAGHLLAIARALRPSSVSLAAVAMARSSHLRSRLDAILDPARARIALTRRAVVPAGFAAAIAVLPVAAASPGLDVPPPDPASSVESPAAHDASSPPRAGEGRRGERPSAGPLSAIADRLASIVPPPPVQQCAWDRRGESASSSTNINDDHVRVRITVGDCRLEIEMEGEVTFTNDDSDVASVSRGGYFEIEEREGGTTRELRIEPSTGGLERRWRVDGETRPYDADARAWLARTLPVVFRRTAINADARARRILAEGGVDALLQEIELIPSDHVAGRYYRILLAQADLGPATIRRVVREAGRRIDSDFELGRLLIAIAEHQPLDEAVRIAYVEAAGSIDSDFEHRRVLSAILQREGLSREMAEAMLRSATRIASDFELARLLMQLVDAHPLDETLAPAFFEAVDGIDSDFQRRRVLSAVLEQGTPRRDVLDRTLLAAQAIGSDFELGRLLIQVAELYPMDGPLPSSYLQATGTIASSHERTRVLTTFVHRERLEPATLVSVLEAATGISSDFEHGRILTAVAERYPLDGGARQAFFRAAGGIESDHTLGQVLAAVIQNDAVSPATSAAVLEASAGIGSDFQLARLLIRMVERGLVTEELRPAFLRATETIQSEHERGKVLSALFPRGRPAER